MNYQTKTLSAIALGAMLVIAQEAYAQNSTLNGTVVPNNSTNTYGSIVGAHPHLRKFLTILQE